jgi:general secretion pathway protein C
MKRFPLLISFFFLVLLCLSLSFWALQLFKPKLRADTTPVQISNFEPVSGQWGGLFGSAPKTDAVISNYQLKGVIVAPDPADSAAIISSDGNREQTVSIGKNIAPNVLLLEVHESYVLLSDAGQMKRVELTAARALSVDIHNSMVTESPASKPPKIQAKAPTKTELKKKLRIAISNNVFSSPSEKPNSALPPVRE